MIGMSSIAGFGDDSGIEMDSLGIALEDTTAVPISPQLIQRLIDKQTYLEASIAETCRILSSLRTEQSMLVESIAQLASSVHQLKDSVNRLSAIGMKTGDFEIETRGSAQHTRQVSSSVPASLIRGVWVDQYPLKELPVPFDYLKKLCDATMLPFSPNVKSAVGSALSKYIDQIEDNNRIHETILVVLSDPDHSAIAEMRRLVLQQMKLLGGYLAFMLPFELSSLLNRVRGINIGKFVMSDEVERSSMVKPNSGYGVISPDHMCKGFIMKAVKALKDGGYTRTSCTSLYHALATGGIKTDGSIQPSNLKERDAVVTLTHVPSTPVKTTSLNVSHIPVMSADDMFSPVKHHHSDILNP